MGQRLVLTIKNNKKDLMKLYYHWSGYTNSAQEILYELADVIKSAQDAGKDERGVLLDIIKQVEKCDENAKEQLSKLFPNFNSSCKGGIDGGKTLHRWSKETSRNELVGPNPEWEYITKLFPEHEFNEKPDRNYGLISMTEKGMEDAQYWSEGDAEINIDTGECMNYTLFPYSSKDDYLEMRMDSYGDSEEDAKKELENMVKIDGNPFEFNYKKDNGVDSSKALYELYVNNGNFSFMDTVDDIIYEGIA